MKFKKALAAFMAAVMVVTGSGFSDLTYAADKLEPNADGVYTITSANVRVNDTTLIYNGKVQKPEVYVDVDGDQTYSTGDFLLTLSKNKTILNSLVATKAGSNVNASASASVILQANKYEDVFFVCNTGYDSATFKIDKPITISYEIAKLDLSTTTVKINGKTQGENPTADFTVGKGVNLTLKGTASNGTDNVVNVYDANGDLLSDVTGITLSNDGSVAANEGSAYTATLTANDGAENFVPKKQNTCKYKALLNVLSDAKITFKDAYKTLTYDGTNQILNENAVSKVTLGEKNLDLSDFSVLVTTEPYADHLLGYYAAADKDAYAKEKGFKDAADLTKKLILNSTTDAGTYYFVLRSSNKYYTGYAETSYTINKLDVSKWTVTSGTVGTNDNVVYNIDATTISYTGSECKPAITAIIQTASVAGKTFTTEDKKNVLTIDYANNVNATQGNTAYVDALTKLGLAKTDKGVVEIFKIDAGFPVGCGDTTKAYADMSDAIKKAYTEENWKKAVTAAEEAYLPQAKLTFNSANITGTVTIKKAFEIKKYDLSSAAITGAETDDTKSASNYTYAISEKDPIELGVNGIQVKNNSNPKIVYPSSNVKVTYSYADFNNAMTFNGYNYTKAGSFSLVGGKSDKAQAVKAEIAVADNNNNLQGVQTVYFVTGKSLNDTAVTFKLTKDTAVYTGSSVRGTIKPVMDMQTATLTEGTDYDIKWYKEDGETEEDPVFVGSYLVTARGKGTYAGTISKKFTVTPKSIDAKTDNVSDVSMDSLTTIQYKSYKSEAVTAAEVAGGKRIVPFGSTVVEDGFVATVTDKKAGSNSNLTTKQYAIAFVNDGDATKTPIAMADVKACGTYSIMMVGKGNYTGTLDSGFDLVVEPQPLNAADITITKTADASKVDFNTAKVTPVKIFYTGSKITVDQLGITVKGYEGKKANDLKLGTDYTATITTDAEKVGEEGVVKITCPSTSNYSAKSEIIAKFKVDAGDLSNDKIYSVELEKGNDAVYAHGTEPKFTIKDLRTDAVIAQEFNKSKINYKAEFDFTTNPVGKDGGILTITGKTGDSSYSGNYDKIRTLKFNTVLSVENLAYGGIVDGTTYDYDGTNKLPQITIQNAEGDTLVKDTDYKVTIMNAEETKTFDTITDVLRTSDKEMSVKGDITPYGKTTLDDYVEYYHVVVEGINKCAGKKVFRLGVNPVSVRSTDIQITAEDQVYTGEYLKPVVVKYGSTVLKEGTDYEISYQNNKDVGTATYIVRGMGNFDRTYSIYDSDPAQFEITATDDTALYTKEELQKKIDEALNGAVSQEELQKKIDEALNGAITKEEADKAVETAKKDAVEEAVKEGTVVTAEDLQKKIDKAVEDATANSGKYTQADLDQAAADALKNASAEALKNAGLSTADQVSEAVEAAKKAATTGMVSEADAKKAQDAAVKAAESKVKTVTAEVKKGQQVVSKKNIYKVTNVSKKTVAFAGTMSTAKTIKIAKSVKINGVTYKVTSIAAKALKGNKTAKKVVIPNTVKKIGKKAFNGMSGVTFKASKKLKKLANKAK